MTSENSENQLSHVPSRRELRARREAALRASGAQADSHPTPVELPSEPSSVPVIEDFDTHPHEPTPKRRQPQAFAAVDKALPESASLVASKKSRFGRNFLATSIVLVLLVALGYGIYYLATSYVSSSFSTTQDYDGTGVGETTVEIPEGATGAKIAQLLTDNGIIASKQSFINALTVNPEGTNIQPGTYKLRNKMSSSAALAGLLDSANRVDAGITIPEGFRISQLRARLIENGGFKAEEVDAALANPPAIGLPEEAKGNPEGWISPGTYRLKPGESAESLIKSMIGKTISTLDSLKVPEGKRQEVLIKASILEREVSIPKYMPKVARVIENRLDPERGKEVLNKLQMDSTVSYAANRTTGIPTADELKKDTPYNTYLHAGLPPTPISFPGVNAIKAVLNPDPGNWLYFVSIDLKTGETVFVDNYEDFKAAKAKLKKFCEDNPKSC